MTIREHTSQHERVEDLPLIARRATVTAVEAMDRDRTAEIRTRLRQLLADAGARETIPDAGPIDWDRLFEAIVAARPRRAPQVGALRDRFERTHPALVRIAFETDQPFDFAPGQYVSLRYDGRTRPYSIASSPNREETEVCVRRVEPGRLSENLCADLSVGDRIAVRGPNGHLLLEEPSQRDLVFLATGTGVAPLKSMIDYTLEEGWDRYRGDPRQIWLFLGAAWRDDLPYHDAFARLDEELDHFHYVPCLSREPWLADWDGETEYIQDALMKYVEEGALADAVVGRHVAEMLAESPEGPVTARIDPHRLEVYACGINAMVYSLHQAVSGLGVPEGHIHCEGYG